MEKLIWDLSTEVIYTTSVFKSDTPLPLFWRAYGVRVVVAWSACPSGIYKAFLAIAEKSSLWLLKYIQ